MSGRRHRWPIVALGSGLTIAVLAAAVWLGLIRPCLEQRAAVAALREVGARFRVKPGRLALARRLLGPEGSDTILECWLDNSPAGDGALEHVGKLASLETLSIERTAIGDARLGELRGLRRLRTLYCGYSQVTGASLPAIAALGRLEYLSLEGLAVADADLAALSALRRLRHLGLDGTRVTDVGLAALRSLPLESLWLETTQVRGPGLADLSGHETLARLWLGHTAVGDEAVDHFATLPALRGLQLTGTRVTGASLPRLLALSGIEALCLRGTHIEDRLLQEAVARHPGMLLDCGDLTPPQRPRPLVEPWLADSPAGEENPP